MGTDSTEIRQIRRSTKTQRRKFSPLLKYLKIRSNTTVDNLLDDALKDLSVVEFTTAWRKGVMKLENDLESAIPAARARLDSDCKHVIEEVGEQCEASDKSYRQMGRLIDPVPD